MKTTSLQLSKKIAALGIECESEYFLSFVSCGDGCKLPGHQGKWMVLRSKESHDAVPAYQLHELVPVLKAIQHRESSFENRKIQIGNAEGYRERIFWNDHWMRICELYAQTESLEGAVESYVMELLK